MNVFFKNFHMLIFMVGKLIEVEQSIFCGGVRKGAGIKNFIGKIFLVRFFHINAYINN